MLPSKNTEWLNEYKNKTYTHTHTHSHTHTHTHICICCLEEIASTLKTQTESELIGKGIPCKWKPKESWSSNTYTRQNAL